MLTLVSSRFAHHYGGLDGFDYPVTHAEAERLWLNFLDFGLAAFGDYQDTMASGEHSFMPASARRSTSDCSTCGDCAPMSGGLSKGARGAECGRGFIRQLIGWREYVRGIYWLQMPDYARRNAFGNDRPLPSSTGPAARG